MIDRCISFFFHHLLNMVVVDWMQEQHSGQSVLSYSLGSLSVSCITKRMCTHMHTITHMYTLTHMHIHIQTLTNTNTDTQTQVYSPVAGLLTVTYHAFEVYMSAVCKGTFLDSLLALSCQPCSLIICDSLQY